MKTSSLKPISVWHYNITQRRVFQSHLGSHLLNSDTTRWTCTVKIQQRKQNPRHRKPKVASALWRGVAWSELHSEGVRLSNPNPRVSWKRHLTGAQSSRTGYMLGCTRIAWQKNLVGGAKRAGLVPKGWCWKLQRPREAAKKIKKKKDEIRKRGTSWSLNSRKAKANSVCPAAWLPLAPSNRGAPGKGDHKALNHKVIFIQLHDGWALSLCKMKTIPEVIRVEMSTESVKMWSLSQSLLVSNLKCRDGWFYVHTTQARVIRWNSMEKMFSWDVAVRHFLN